MSYLQMAPHPMERVLQPPQWPTVLSEFVTSCLMWDPKSRPTCGQALNHEYFADAVDPLRPKSSSSSKLLGRKHSDKSFKSPTLAPESPNLAGKPSWFRRSLIGRSDSPAPSLDNDSTGRPPAVLYNTVPDVQPGKTKPANNKRATWTNGAPMPILPSIRPVSPLSNTVTAQANAHGETSKPLDADAGKASKKIGRQLSVNSNGNHYTDVHRQEAERMLNGSSNTPSPKESFFSHLRKRARRISGRNQTNAGNDDIEANAGCIPWSNRSSMALDGANLSDSKPSDKPSDLSELDKALSSVKYAMDSTLTNVPVHLNSGADGNPKRQSMPQTTSTTAGPISSRTRRALQMSTHPVHRYETPEEEDELLDEVLHSTNKAARRLALTQSLAADSPVTHRQIDNSHSLPSPFPTPSPTAKDGFAFGPTSTPSKLTAQKPDHASSNRQWPTPPYEEAEWNSKASSHYFAAGSNFI